MTIVKQLWTKEVEEPERKNSYQYVFELREKLEDTLKLAHSELQKAQQKGKHYYDRKSKVRRVIRESSSPYASPVVVVKKKDDTNLVCGDYRKLNKITVFDPGPIPTHDSCDGRCFYKVTISRWKPSTSDRFHLTVSFISHSLKYQSRELLSPLLAGFESQFI